MAQVISSIPKYVILTLIFFTIYGQSAFAPMGLAIIICVYGILYYIQVFSSMSGLMNFGLIDGDANQLKTSTTKILINFTGVMTLIVATPYTWLGFISLPYAINSIATLALLWLMHYNIVEIISKDD